MTEPDRPDWSSYRQCPVCKAELGQPCRVRSGRIVNGRPDQAGQVDAAQPHHSRPRRTRRSTVM